MKEKCKVDQMEGKQNVKRNEKNHTQRDDYSIIFVTVDICPILYCDVDNRFNDVLRP